MTEHTIVLSAKSWTFGTEHTIYSTKHKVWTFGTDRTYYITKLKVWTFGTEYTIVLIQTKMVVENGCKKLRCTKLSSFFIFKSFKCICWSFGATSFSMN